MKNISRLFIPCLLLLPSFSVMAENIKSLALFYDEVEQGVGAQSMRYIINDQYLRIDNGDDKADYILFEVSKNNIYSVNHDDQTILKIEKNIWFQPEFDFKVTTNESVMKGAPKIYSKIVYSYQVKAGEKVCTKVFLIKDVFADEMNILYNYQRVLSGQQVVSLKNTPKELHTPCFLVDQVYHSGDYYRLGLPVQISYSRDYAKFLKDFKEIEIDNKLFKLPEGYSEYGAFIE